MEFDFEKLKQKVKIATGGVIIKKDTFNKFYYPLIKQYIDNKTNNNINTYIIGIQGCQGVGKTSLTIIIKIYLKLVGYEVQEFSIDDFYKSHDERIKVGELHTNNSFFQISRGMPGTHRYNDIIKELRKAKKGEKFEIPIFDKSLNKGRGDITKEIIKVEKKLDFLIIEGWCVNLPYVEPQKFIEIMNKNDYVKRIFEKIDPEKKNFKIVIEYIKQYQKIWELFDNKTILHGENIEWIESWRIEQEKRMISIKGEGMTDKEIHDFVKPYIPFTYLLYNEVINHPQKFDCILNIGWDHLPKSHIFNH